MGGGEDQRYHSVVGYVESLKSVRDTVRPCLKGKNRNKNKSLSQTRSLFISQPEVKQQLFGNVTKWDRGGYYVPDVRREMEVCYPVSPLHVSPEPASGKKKMDIAFPKHFCRIGQQRPKAYAWYKLQRTVV